MWRTFAFLLAMSLYAGADDSNKAVLITGQIAQVNGSSILIHCMIYELSPEAASKSFKEISRTDIVSTSVDQFVCISGVQTGLVDDDHWAGLARPNGTYSYVGTDGAKHTVHLYATSPDTSQKLRAP